MRKFIGIVLVLVGATLGGCNAIKSVAYVLDESYDQRRADMWNPPPCVHETNVSVDVGVGVRSDSYYDQYNYGYTPHRDHD